MAKVALMVFTAKTVEAILNYGGTQSWALGAKSMNGVQYVICTRNSDRVHDTECGPRSESHGEAFLVGRISGLRKLERRNGRDRYLVLFGEYALISVKDAWSGDRNPFRYLDQKAVDTIGIEVEKLDFRPMPSLQNDQIHDVHDIQGLSDDQGLTIAEAKIGLAVKFGVPVESVQITIVA